MHRCALLLALVCCSLPAQADWFYTLVGFTCNRSTDELVVHYKGAYNDAGEALIAARTETEWRPEELIESMASESTIGTVRSVEATCTLRHATYTLRIGPSPENWNTQGECGGETNAWVEVQRDRRVVLPRYDLVTACRFNPSSSRKVTTQIFFRRLGPPKMRRVPYEKFLR